LDESALEAALNRLAPILANEPGWSAGRARRLSGGASQETWALSLVKDAERRNLILRRRPDGLSARDDRTVALSTEAALIEAVRRRGGPAPAVLRVCPPEDGLGEAYVMAEAEGETLGKRIVRDEMFAAVRPGLARRCGEVLALIHATPLEGLPPLTRASARDEIERYEAIYRGTGAARPVLEWAFRRLMRRAPPPGPQVLLHGDFRNGNLMIHPEHGLTAVLDWELAHIGDAASDLGWLCVNSWRFGAYEKPVGGFGAYEDLLAGYHDAGGTQTSLEAVRYWQMLGSLKWGVMCLIMHQAYASGADPSVERAMIGRRVSEVEIDLVNLMEDGL
jgi:aminoglycoside phosphotransferase (APT) family kinase protein